MLAVSKGEAYASPPISPFDSQSQKENMNFVEDQGTRDPPLFVLGGPVASIASDQPLFPASQESADIITEHMESQAYKSMSKKQQPERADYELVAHFRHVVYEEIKKDPRAWRAREREYERYYTNCNKPTGVQKRSLKALAPAPSSRPRMQRMALPRLPPRVPRVPKTKRTPQTQVLDSFEGSPLTTSPKPARPAGTRDDVDYSALADYCPPLDTIPKGNSKILKADWKGSQLDLSNDPDRVMLHEAELVLAATLRLNCATYLCSKRRIFMARVDALKRDKEFRKTDAQQACKIDVNKASKLWQSYDRIGWFDRKYFQNLV